MRLLQMLIVLMGLVVCRPAGGGAAAWTGPDADPPRDGGGDGDDHHADGDDDDDDRYDHHGHHDGDDDDDHNGLRAEWTWGAGHATNLGQIDWADSDETTVASQVNWGLSHGAFLDDESADNFGVRLTGRILVTTAGAWGFALWSDEAAALWIDGQLVVDDGALHSYRLSAGSITLAQGYHAIEIRYLERSWSNGLILEWTPPGGAAEVVPASAFSHLDESPDTSGGGLRAYWSAGVSHATELGEVDWHRYTASSAVDNLAWRITHAAFSTDGPTDSFAARYVGKIVIPESGAWTFNLGSDEAASLLIDGQEVVYDGEPHSFRWSAGLVTLAAGQHDIDVRYLERSWSAGLVLTWKGPSDLRESVVPKSALIPGDTADLGSSGVGGLRAYWTHGVSHATSTGQVAWDSYGLSTVVPRVSWDLTHGSFEPSIGADSFALRLIGKINIPEEGSWEFNLGSDEGVEMYVDGSPVIYDPSPHSYRWESGSRSLAAGLHDLDIRFLERSWTAGLHLTWKGPSDTHRSIVPTSALTPSDLGVGSSPGRGLAAYWSSGVSHATNLGQIDWDRFDHTSTEAAVAWPITHDAFYTDGPTDSFACRLLATIEIPATGDWTFNLGSDEAASLIIDGQEIIYDGAPHSFGWRPATLALDAGPHDLEIRYLERSWSGGLNLTWRGPTVPSEEVVPTAALTPRPMTAAGGGGLRAFWTTGTSHATQLGYIDWLDYDTTTLVENIAWPISHESFYAGGPTDSFACRLLGTIEIPASGSWTFNLGSDEAASLLIDGEEVVYDGDAHSFQWSDGSRTLSAGPHAIEVRFLDRSWSAGLVLTWRGPGDLHESVVASSALTPATESDFGDGGAGGLTAYWSSGVGHATRLGQVDWNRYDHVTTEENLSWRITHSAFYLGGPTDSFAGRFYGTIAVPESGAWQFHLGSDEAAELRIDGQTVVLHNIPHSFGWIVGYVDLPAGPHTIEVRHLERSWSSGLFLAWQGPSDTHPTVVPSSALTPGAATFPGDEGIVAEWFSGGGAYSLDGVDWSASVAINLQPNISWKLTHSAFYAAGPSDNFAGRLRGKLVVPETGMWTFGLGSDECADLSIDGSVVASDAAGHPFRWQEGTAYLQAGIHDLEVRHLERSWSAGLLLTWQGPSDEQESVIPADAFRPAARLRMVQWQETDPSQ